MADEIVAPVITPGQAPTPTPIGERIKSLTGDAAEHWKMTGDLDAAEALAGKRSDVQESASSPDAASETPETEVETGAASEPAAEEQPKTGETPEQKSERKRRNDIRRLRDAHKVELELATERTKRELLEKQLAESTGKSAPPKTEEKFAEAADDLEPPNLEDYKTVAEFTKANREFYKNLRAAIKADIENSHAAKSEAVQAKAATDKWNGVVDAGRRKYGKDFEAVAFNSKVTASFPQILEVQNRDDGHELMYHFGKNPEVSQKLAELTDIPLTFGKFETAKELQEAMDKNPRLAYIVGEKRALARIELDRIAKNLKTATRVTPPKETIANQPKPSGELEIEPKGSAVEDVDAGLIKRAASGDKNAAATWKARENKRQLAEMMGT